MTETLLAGMRHRCDYFCCGGAEMKLTPWFPGHIKPVRVGAYDVADGKDFLCPWFFWWDGEQWSGYGASPEECFKYRSSNDVADCWQMKARWRGVAR